MINPMQIIQVLMQGGNPMTAMMQMFGGNPQFQRACDMLRGKTPQQMQETVANSCKSMGVDFDRAVQQMKGLGVDVMSGSVQEPNPEPAQKDKKPNGYL